MELPLSFCFTVLSTILAVWFLKRSAPSSKRKHRKQQLVLPPGPWSLPIIGSLHHVTSTLLHRRMMELSGRFGPLMHLKLGEVPTVVVSSAEAAALVMKTHDPAFAGRPSTTSQDIAGRGIIFAPYGHHWRQMRKVCIVELLSSSQVRRMESIRTEEVGNLLRYIANNTASTTINLSERAMALSNNVVSRAVFGGKFAQQEEYIREMDVMLTLLGSFSLLNLFPSSRLARWISIDERRLQRSYGRMQRIIENVIEGRQHARADGDVACSTDDEDLVDVLLRLQKEDSSEFPLTRESIFAVLVDIFSGATDTTGTALEWAMSELVRHPHVLDKAYLEIQGVLGEEDRCFITNRDVPELPYLRMIIKEALRLHTPLPLIPRMAREDCKIMGYDILNGTTVLINAFAVSRDPTYWKNPQEFIPERFENNNIEYVGQHFEYTPFGAGRRQCPGMVFSTSTLEIALANLIYHFEWVIPGGGSPKSLDMSEKFGTTVGRRYGLHLIAVPRRCIKACKHM